MEGSWADTYKYLEYPAVTRTATNKLENKFNFCAG